MFLRVFRNLDICTFLTVNSTYLTKTRRYVSVKGLVDTIWTLYFSPYCAPKWVLNSWKRQIRCLWHTEEILKISKKVRFFSIFDDISKIFHFLELISATVFNIDHMYQKWFFDIFSMSFPPLKWRLKSEKRLNFWWYFQHFPFPRYD